MKLIMVSEWKDRPRYLDVMRVRCKQWGCPYCSPINGQQWRQYLLKKLNTPEFADRKWALITLTANEQAHYDGAQATLRNLQRVWGLMRRKLLRYNGQAFDYIRVFERHTKGKFGGFHMHIIADLGACYSRKKAEFAPVLEREARARRLGLKPRHRLKKERHPARWIKDECRATGGGFIADFRPLQGGSRRAIQYVTKYVVKQIEMNEFPKYMRRIQTTRGVGSPKKKGVSKIRAWRARAAIFREDLRIYERIFDISIKREITLEDDFSDNQLWYPPELE